MAVIEASVEINATKDKVWQLISDIDNEPRFWKGTKAIQNISSENNKITREITIAFRDQKCMQEVTLIPKERIEAVFTKGIIDGTKQLTVTPKNDTTILKVEWNIKLTGIMSMFTGMITKHIKNGTEQALQLIKDELER
jgi:carbon monoxide dehydrogenase subunit G